MTILDRPAKRFRIDIQDPQTWPVGAPLPPTLRTITRAVRHECIHIRVNDFTPDDPTDADIQAEEEAVWAIEGAFDRITNAAQPRIAAMVVKQLGRKQQTLSQVAGQIRAMTATAATRQTKGRSMAMDPATAKTLLDALDSDDIAVVKAAVRKVAEDALTGGEVTPPSVPDPNAPPMGAEVGAVDPNKNKPPMAMGDDKKPDQMMRSMAARFDAKMAELDAALVIVRPSVKLELVRSMRADGVALTPYAEKLIEDAPTIHEAQTIAKGMRAMAPAGARKEPAKQPNGGNDGLTAAQNKTYRGMVAKGNPGADAYRDECVKENARTKGGK
jgi:hypothetical protein